MENGLKIQISTNAHSDDLPQTTVHNNLQPGTWHLEPSCTLAVDRETSPGNKPEPIILLVLPIILILFPCHHLLFLLYSLIFCVSHNEVHSIFS